MLLPDGGAVMRIALVGDSLTRGLPGSSYVEILQKRLPDCTLVNLGRGNETVVSLYRRLKHIRFDAPFDIAFLWIGTNDVDRRGRWSFQLVNLLLHTPPSRNLDEFGMYYWANLDLLHRNARRVIAVSPLLRGEDPGNEWNRQLEVLSDVIESLTAQWDRVEYLDLRKVFARELASRPTPDYRSRGMVRVALDVLTLRRRRQIDRKAAKRGLHFTLDGVHLNSAGAEIVAQAFLKAISRHDGAGSTS
jgi:lysophospholipase L1-like esterase